MKKKEDPGSSGMLNEIPEKFKISDEDIHAAMKEIPGYLDITTSDFRELYSHSYRHALDRVINSVRAGDIMTRNVVSVKPETPLREVADRMAAAGVSGIPVVDRDEKVQGIISERDFLQHMGAEKGLFMSVVAACLVGQGCAALGIRKGAAKDIMSAPVITVSESASVAEAAALMTRYGVNRLPVLDEQGKKLLGILTRGDLVRTHVFD
ncbi:MAG: CBS domain-containing protein [Desulfobulbaceae bacterium]|nr:CBS domain-containing protein [Desulfobulbaceae bacterium]